MDLNEIPTPALVLELGRLKQNLAFMSGRAKELGVDLRPHLKTAKCAEVAWMATRGHSGGITVSTLREARYFAANGFRDITYAIGVAPGKLDECFSLIDNGVNLKLLTDNVEGAKAVGEKIKTRKPADPVNVLIEIDCGDERGGIAAGSDELPYVARLLAEFGANVAGILTHAGQSYACTSIQQIADVAETERESAVSAASVLRQQGHEVKTVSVGSTPTSTHAQRLDGVTEMRPGVYMFGDLDQAGLGSLPENRIAVTVLASVIGCYPERGTVIVDAGGLALSKDASAQRHNPDNGYGRVLDIRARPVPGGFVCSANQEHGILRSPDLPFDELKLDARVRILPNHICMTAAAHPGYYLVDDGTEVIDQWRRVNGWTD